MSETKANVMAEPYQLPTVTVLDIALSYGVATTTIEIDQDHARRTITNLFVFNP